MKVKSVLLMIGLIMHFYSINGQNLTFEYGAMFVPHKSESELHPDIRSESYLTGSQNFLKINYEHSIKKDLFLMGSFTKHEVSTSMDFYRGEDASWDVGWVGTDVVYNNQLYSINISNYKHTFFIRLPLDIILIIYCQSFLCHYERTFPGKNPKRINREGRCHSFYLSNLVIFQ